MIIWGIFQSRSEHQLASDFTYLTLKLLLNSEVSERGNVLTVAKGMNQLDLCISFTKFWGGMCHLPFSCLLWSAALEVLLQASAPRGTRKSFLIKKLCNNLHRNPPKHSNKAISSVPDGIKCVTPEIIHCLPAVVITQIYLVSYFSSEAALVLFTQAVSTAQLQGRDMLHLAAI